MAKRTNSKRTTKSKRGSVTIPVVDVSESKGGRPQTEISEKDWKVIQEMAREMCSHQEIADYLGISKRTFYAAHLRERFDRVTKMARAATVREVRKRQLQAAKKGMPVSSIWWGKQHLGQADKVEHTGADGGPLEVIAGAEERLIQVLDKLASKRN